MATVLRIYYWTGSTSVSSQQRTDNVTAGPVDFTDLEVDRIILTPNFNTSLLESWYTEPSLKSLIRPTPTPFKSPESLNLGWKIDSKFDLSKADAEFKDGLLKISIPFTKGSELKTLKIK